MNYSVEYEDLTFEECFQRIFEKLNYNDVVIQKQNEENKKLNDKIDVLNLVIQKQNDKICVLDNTIQKHNKENKILNNKICVLLYNTIQKQNEKNIIINDKINMLDDIIDGMQNDKIQIGKIQNDIEKINYNLVESNNNTKHLTEEIQNQTILFKNDMVEKINYSYLNENRYFILINKLKINLELENYIFGEIKESRYLPITTDNKINQQKNNIWYYLNCFTSTSVLKMYFDENIIEKEYEFNVLNLFTRSKSFMKMQNFKLENIKQELFQKTFENNKSNDNDILNSIDFEYKNEELENLLLESYERYECLKLIKNNDYDINKS